MSYNAIEVTKSTMTVNVHATKELRRESRNWVNKALHTEKHVSIASSEPWEMSPRQETA